MQFETFRGRTVEEAVAAVKAALGSDAMIGSTRRISNDRSGQLGSAFVEVSAAPSPKNPAQAQYFARELAARSEPGRKPAAAPSVRARLVPAAATLASRTAELDLREELQAIRTLLEEVTSSQPPRTRVAALLKSARIEGKLAAKLSAGASRLPVGSDLRRWLRQRIAERIRILPSPIEQPGPRIIACVGPTGVGKTTTIAKLAARAHLELGRSAAIVSLDSFRVGSAEQMKRFAELIGIHVDLAQDRDSFRRLLGARRAELTFVDTASLPASDALASRTLSECLAAADDRPRDVLLVVPAGIHPHDAERLVASYAHTALTAVVVTKLDEAGQFGGALHAVLPSALPLAYLCHGPRVPEDIQSATVQAVLDAALPVSEDHAS